MLPFMITVTLSKESVKKINVNESRQKFKMKTEGAACYVGSTLTMQALFLCL